MTTLEPAKVIAVVDNDQCIGDWRPLGAMYIFVRNHAEKLERSGGITLDPKAFAATAIKCGLVRPGLPVLFRTLRYLRDVTGAVEAIVMCTAASDRTGWVAFLKEVLEHVDTMTNFDSRDAPGRTPLYDVVLDREAMVARHVATGHTEESAWDAATGCLWKHMEYVVDAVGWQGPAPIQVVSIDDRPAFVKGASVTLGVTPFFVNVSVEDLVRAACWRIEDVFKFQDSLGSQMGWGPPSGKAPDDVIRSPRRGLRKACVALLGALPHMTPELMEYRRQWLLPDPAPVQAPGSAITPTHTAALMMPLPPPSPPPEAARGKRKRPRDSGGASGVAHHAEPV